MGSRYARLEIPEPMNDLGLIQAKIQLHHVHHPTPRHNRPLGEAWMEQLEEEGIASGYPGGTYRPENQVSRAEMAVFLVNAFSLALL